MMMMNATPPNDDKDSSHHGDGTTISLLQRVRNEHLASFNGSGFQRVASSSQKGDEHSDDDSDSCHQLQVPLGNATDSSNSSSLHSDDKDSSIQKLDKSEISPVSVRTSLSSSFEDDDDIVKKLHDVELGQESSSPTAPLTTSNNSDDSKCLSDDDFTTEAQQQEDFAAVLKDRAIWLVGLLVLQSCSSFILKHNEELLSKHMVIVRFLTMLVGAGGNAGNQASVRVIRGLATGAVNDSNVKPFIQNELFMGLCLSAILGVAGCIRAAIFMTPLAETLAITASLFIIVIVSVAIGAALPVLMKRVGIDPAHSSTTIQVLMDILGVTITLYVSAAILDSAFGTWLGAAVGGNETE